MTRGGLDHVRRNPQDCARWLSTADVVAGTKVTVVLHDLQATIFDVRFESPTLPELPDYPAEQVRVTVRANGKVLAVPASGDDREWLHRYPRSSIADLLALPKSATVPWELIVGALCLEYPNDPDHLRWQWSDGIDAYLRVVQRHLWYEEYWRRHGSWPVEDAPHGHRPDGHPHPILTPELQVA
ncbi:MAG: hypothetical protein OXI26_08055 [bacterium]|nr:hypothetical protein [bacterium]